MNIIKIESLENGAHDNAQNISFVFDGWAVIPDSIAVPSTFPFVDITVDNSVPPVVLTMEAGTVPEPDPVTPEISAEDTLLDMAADHEERLCMLELNS
jgi:hypothetical protein